MDHERYEDETFVAINGPEVVHCDPLVKESMEEYWRQFLRAGDRGGHFVRRSPSAFLKDRKLFFCLCKDEDVFFNTPHNANKISVSKRHYYSGSWHWGTVFELRG